MGIFDDQSTNPVSDESVDYQQSGAEQLDQDNTPLDPETNEPLGRTSETGRLGGETDRGLAPDADYNLEDDLDEEAFDDVATPATGESDLDDIREDAL